MKEIHKFLISLEVLILIVIVCRYVEGKLVVNPTGTVIEYDEGMDSKEEENTEEIEAKKVALTFDDGPNEKYTGELLDGLKAKEVKATFFLIGKKIEGSADLVKRMSEEGHLLGNHSYDHVNLCDLSQEDAESQIEMTNEVLIKVTGESTEYMRSPFGCDREELDAKMNMIQVLWDVDPRDWSLKNTGTIVNRVVTKVEDGDIILLHDESATSIAAALEIIDILKSRGFEFVTVDEIILD